MSTEDSSSTRYKPPNSKDAAWKHGYMPDPKNHLKVICNYCNKDVSGITRLKCHLAGIHRDVSECEKVPPEAITIFLYAHTRVLNLMRTHLGKDLVRAGVTRFATAFLNLKSIQEKKDELKKLFRSDELDAWGYLKKDKGRKATGYVRSDSFWQGVDYAIKIFEPLVNVLRRVDGDVPAMGFLFGDLFDAKKEIEILLDEEKEKYSAVHEIIDKRWDDKLKTPLHLAGFFLNPYYYFANRMLIERNGNFRAGLISCMETMYDIETAEKMLEELPRYQRSEGSFGRPLAIKGRSTKKLNPAEWWANYGATTPYLKSMAIRILSLTCSSSGCERNWSTFEQVHNVDVVANEDNEWVAHHEEESNDETVTSKKRKTSGSASSHANLAKKKKKIIILGEDNDSPSSSDEDEEDNGLSDSE